MNLEKCGQKDEEFMELQKKERRKGDLQDEGGRICGRME